MNYVQTLANGCGERVEPLFCAPVYCRHFFGLLEQMSGRYGVQGQPGYGDLGRDAVLYLARQRSGMTYPEICERACIDNYKAAEKAVERFQKRVQGDSYVRKIVERCLLQMSRIGT